jgi:hypothetical protein
MVLDAALGPSNPGALGTINNAAGDAIGVPKKIKPGFAKLGSALSGALTLKLDSDEVEDARKILEALKDRMRRVEKTMKMLEPFLDTDGEKLEKMQVAFENAVARARSAQGRYRSAESQRLGLLRELQDLR